RDRRCREDRRGGRHQGEAEGELRTDEVVPQGEDDAAEGERQRGDDPEPGEKDAPRLPQERTYGAEIGAQEGEDEEEEDAGADQRPGEARELGQRQADEDGCG